MVTLGILLGGCFSETYQRGYIVPDGALEQIPLGSSAPSGTMTSFERCANCGSAGLSSIS